MLKVIVLLSGVKTTSNKLAVKLELSWQELRDLDSINRMAEAPERRVRSVVTKTNGDNIDGRMAGGYVSTSAVKAKIESLRLLPRVSID